MTSRQLSEDVKCMQVALAIGFLEIVRSMEFDDSPKSARATALRNLIDNSWKVCDQFKTNSWPPAKLKFADEVLTAAEVMVNQRADAYFNWHSGWE